MFFMIVQQPLPYETIGKVESTKGIKKKLKK